MSYILDALKRAEAERNTGTTPGPLPAQSAAPVPLVSAPATRGPWLWPALAVSACALAGFIWLRPAPPPPAATAAPPAPVTAASIAPKPPEPAPQEVLEETQQEMPHEALVKAKPPRKAGPKKDPVPAAALAAASIATLSELPDAVRQEIPALKVGGYIYSSNKAERSVLINNRLLREGDEAAPGLILEKMLPNGMVLNYKGYQYRMGY